MLFRSPIVIRTKNRCYSRMIGELTKDLIKWIIEEQDDLIDAKVQMMIRPALQLIRGALDSRNNGYLHDVAEADGTKVKTGYRLKINALV